MEKFFKDNFDGMTTKKALLKIKRIDTPYVEQGGLICFLLDSGMTTKEIIKSTGIGVQTIRMRIKLYERLTLEERQKVYTGEITQDKALLLIKTRSLPEIAINRERRTPRFNEFEKWYRTGSARNGKILSEEIREFIAKEILQIEYTPKTVVQYIADIYLTNKEYVIGHFGCGAKTDLADYLFDNTVYSFNQVDIDDAIVCDLSKIPFRDKELDIAIFSIPTNNSKDNFAEAFRLLKSSGQIFVISSDEVIQQYLAEIGFTDITSHELKDCTLFTARKM